MNRRIIAVSVALALSTTMAFAGGDHHGRHGKQHGFHGKLEAKLNLTEAQKQRIADIRKATKLQHASFFESAKQTRQAVKAAREANDTAKIEALKSTLDSQRAQMKQIRDAEKQQILAVLDAAQRAEFEKLEAQRSERRGDRQPRN